MTIPNVALNLYDETLRDASTADEHLAESVSSRATFYSGDWASVNQLLSGQNKCENKQGENVAKDTDAEGRKFDLILSSETIYNPSCHKKLLDLMTTHLKHEGVMYPYILYHVMHWSRECMSVALYTLRHKELLLRRKFTFVDKAGKVTLKQLAKFFLGKMRILLL